MPLHRKCTTPKIDQKNEKFEIFGLDTFKACKILNENASICYLMKLEGGKIHNSVDPEGTLIKPF